MSHNDYSVSYGSALAYQIEKGMIKAIKNGKSI